MTTTETAETAGATPTFAETLRKRSWAFHQEAEGSGFLEALMKGELTRDAYTAMVAQHYWAYVVLDDAADTMREHPVGAPFADARLDRRAILEADMLFLAGEGWQERWPANEATRRYTDRMREKCYDWAGGFVAHHYTRYLGDMSGGQFIAKQMRKHYDLPGTRGSDFYVFDGLGDLTVWKDAYRAAMNDAPWDEAEQELVIQEVLFAYDINSAVLRELGRDLDRYRKAA
ncbi:heme oxygenase (biliverdin-producing) [Embleya sp. NPDC056575]|uniref:biliverdin-producing heme oxygenase n=1 Tax=unclassified Embleya TaxID=2699296 RepID=UPI0036A4694C